MYQPVSIQKEVCGEGTSLLICGSALKLPAEIRALEGQVQCVYIDPPFMTGKSFQRKRFLGERGWRRGTPALSLPGFEDSFESEKDYLRLLRRLIQTAHALLRDTGVFCLHLDWRMSARARLLCDKVFGAEGFLNEVIWSYESGGRSRKMFPRKHDTILLYGKSPRYRFDLTRLPMDRKENRKNHMARGVDPDGRTYSRIVSSGREYRYYDDEPVYPGDVWTDIGFLQQRDPERTGFITQKPLKLLERLLLPVTRPGDWVADLCCGSGTTLAAAEKLGCHYAGLDISPQAVSVSLARLKAENLTVLCPCGMDGTALLAEMDDAACRLRIRGLDLKGDWIPEKAGPMDLLESWEIGTLEGDTFLSRKRFQRSFIYPALVDSLRPEHGCMPDLMTTDAAGVRRAYRWVDTFL